jgi:putative spermidine/putrescine transport system substrate-binding protein
MKTPRYRKLSRSVLGGAVALTSLGVVPPAALAQLRPGASTLQGTITFYSSGDVNVEQIWDEHLIPAYQKAYPGDKIRLIFSQSGAQDTTDYDAIAASVKAGQKSPVDLVESGATQQAAIANLLTKVTTTNLPAKTQIDPSLFAPVNDEAVPIRGSEVLLAYNSKDIASPPQTLAQVISWIEANPGKFAYCNPNDGGSGNAFVEAVLNKFVPAAAQRQMALAYAPSLEKEYWPKGFALLKTLGADVFDHEYPTSNTGTLTLLSSGSIDMGTVWSDQGLTALKDGQLPPYIKLTEITPQLAGGPDYIGVPKNSANQALAFQFLNWVLQPTQQTTIVKVMNGTPGIEYKYMPGSIQKEFISFGSDPALGYSSDTGNDMVQQWQREVAQ